LGDVGGSQSYRGVGTSGSEKSEGQVLVGSPFERRSDGVVVAGIDHHKEAAVFMTDHEVCWPDEALHYLLRSIEGAFGSGRANDLEEVGDHGLVPRIIRSLL
jgi:hypothetical protein